MRIGFFPVLFLIFLTLKLTHVITWSWWWVSAPLWWPLGICAAVAAAYGAVLLLAIIGAMIEHGCEKVASFFTSK